MAKLIFCFFLLYTCSFSFAQTNEKNTTLNCLANWRKGEKKLLLISRNKEKFDNGKKTSDFDLRYEAHITILDSTAEGYSIQWLFELPADFKKNNPGIEKLLPVYNGLKILFTTDEAGSFKDLVNWEDVRDAYFSMTELSRPKRSNDTTAQSALNQAKALFNSKKMVEAALIKEILLYYAPYGGEFTTNGISSPTSLPNPFGGEPMPAIATQKISQIDVVSGSFTALFTQQLDSTGTGIMMNSLFKSMNVPSDSIAHYAKDMLANFQVKDDNEYRIIQSTGWITNLKHERTGITAQMKQTETFIYKME